MYLCTIQNVPYKCVDFSKLICLINEQPFVVPMVHSCLKGISLPDFPSVDECICTVLFAIMIDYTVDNNAGC